MNCCGTTGLAHGHIDHTPTAHYLDSQLTDTYHQPSQQPRQHCGNSMHHLCESALADASSLCLRLPTWSPPKNKKQVIMPNPGRLRPQGPCAQLSMSQPRLVGGPFGIAIRWCWGVWLYRKGHQQVTRLGCGQLRCDQVGRSSTCTYMHAGEWGSPVHACPQSINPNAAAFLPCCCCLRLSLPCTPPSSCVGVPWPRPQSLSFGVVPDCYSVFCFNKLLACCMTGCAPVLCHAR